MVVLVLVGVMICGIVWSMHRERQQIRRSEAQAWKREALLAEVERAAQDFLDSGKAVAEASYGKYRGIISIRLHVDPKTREGYVSLSMYDTGDLNSLDGAVLAGLGLDGFVKKYGYFFDPERDAIVYETGGGVYFQPGEERLLLQTILHRVRKHPLAVIKGENVVATRGI